MIENKKYILIHKNNTFFFFLFLTVIFTIAFCYDSFTQPSFFRYEIRENIRVINIRLDKIEEDIKVLNEMKYNFKKLNDLYLNYGYQSHR